MTDNLPREPEEQLIATWLQPLEEDAVPYQKEHAARAEDLALAVFIESDSPRQQHPPSSPRGLNMIAKAMIALSAMLGTLFWFTSQDSAIAQMTLDTVLDRTTEAKSLELKINRNGKTETVWVKLPGKVRWETSEKEYAIAKGTRLWRIDESQNQFRVADNPWIVPEGQRVDLLRLIGLDRRDSARFRETEAVETAFHEGRLCRLFRMTTEHSERRWHLEARADAQSGLLKSLAVWPADNRQGPPLAELALVARDVAVDEDKFKVAESLSEDGRIGKLTDAQGIVTLQPVLSRRWTPVGRQMLIKPGDWLRTDVRGANAATVALTSQYQLILGPGSLVELLNPHQVRIHRGEARLKGEPSAEKPVEVLSHNNKPALVAAGESAHYRVHRRGNLQALQKKPAWLLGYEGSAVNESLGSLVAKIDGRDVPLSVGYHKVRVEIRDQIARTTIEESFVNRTKHTLEGVFHFPLPQDASISGFGMWIGDELVEADVVEKQRAREIYETILREKRDPGLLEWTGGNIFKARVYPIPARSEKRIRIVYTQVLPMRGNQYRYSYGLRSELLRKTPVRELSLDVQVHSALPLKSVQCPTHATRTNQAMHSAEVKFAAQEYTPERDFEVVCEVDAKNSDVVVIPHQRGDDGYFLVQLSPPSGEGRWERKTIPDGDPLELLLVCDTSASMDSANRSQLAEFVAAVLASLGPNDRFNLAVCDVDCQWYSKAFVEKTGEHAEQARDWLEERVSLGWTDLEAMAKSVLKKATDQTHVIYIGDGIVTAGGTDPKEFVNRLKRLTDNKRTGTFHAVSVGNSFESTVLKALARVGGGSLRQIGGERTPQKAALELLNEIAQPSLRNLKVEFRGLQVAAVYPDTLPNLAAGTQQILIGRYLPTGKNQTGEIIVTGDRNGESVRFASRITLADAEAGNSFIPRLWARAHLEQLLAQGTSAAIKDQIIAMSEEYHIITPYTSLLVLETDEDRERFGVKRRYQMRDGERFFAKGTEDSRLELLRKQMKEAGDWRLNLRRKVLTQLSRLGRNTQIFDRLMQPRGSAADYRFNAPMGMPVSSTLSVSGEWFEGYAVGGTEFGRFSGVEISNGLGKLISDSESPDAFFGDEMFAMDKDAIERFDSFDIDVDTNGALAVDRSPLRAESRKKEALSLSLVDGLELDFKSLRGEWTGRGIQLFEPNQPMRFFERGGRIYDHQSAYQAQQYIQWLNDLFPDVPHPAGETQRRPEKWKGEALAISRSLVQPIVIERGGLEIIRDSQSRDPDWNRVTSRSRQVELFAKAAWLSYSENAAGQTIVDWTTSKQRGRASKSFQTGRVRPSIPRDWETYKPGQRPYAETGLHETYRDYDVVIQKPAENRVEFTLSYQGQDTTTVITIDTHRHVILAIASRRDGKFQSKTTYGNFVETAGVFWPGTIETFDEQSRRTSLVKQSVKSLTEAAFDERLQDEIPDDEEFLLLDQIFPSLRNAEQAVADASADVEDHMLLLLRATLRQQWNDVFQQLTSIETLAGDREGMAWLKAAILIAAGKNEDARQLLIELADQIVQEKPDDAFYLAGYVLDQTARFSNANEVIRLQDRLKPVFDRQPEHVDGKRQWVHRRIQSLRSLARRNDVLALQKTFAESAPWDVSAHTQYARDLAAAGDHAAAYAWLRKELDRKVEREHYAERQLWDTHAQLLRDEGRDEDLVTLIKQWMESAPEDQTPQQQYLAALIMADRLEDADETAQTWLTAGRSKDKLSLEKLSRLNSAVYYALGQRHNIYMNWIDPTWLKPLEETAVFFLEHDHHPEIATRIIDHHRFRDTEENDRIRKEVARRLREKAASLEPNVLNRFVNWTINQGVFDPVDLSAIEMVIRKRWDDAKDPDKRRELGDVLATFYSHLEGNDDIEFLRTRISHAVKEKDDRQAASLRQTLFNSLIAREWTEEHEAEAFALIEQLTYNNYFGQTTSDSTQLLIRVRALHHFVDRMLEGRVKAAEEQLQDQGHPEKLTRSELADKSTDFETSAQKALRNRLKNRLAEKPDSENREYLQWVRLERMYWDLQLGENGEQVANECWQILGEQPKPPTDETSPAPWDENYIEKARGELISALAEQRAFVMANYLAVRKSAEEKLIGRVKDYVAAGMEFEGDESARWRQAQFALLIALDEPELLERDLRSWIRSDPFPAPWQKALARLRAERGKIQEAIGLFEAARKASPLSPADWQALGDWYLVVDAKQDYRKAKIESFKQTPEYQLSRWIRRRRERWRREDLPLPTEVDKEVLFAFQALFEKSNRPEGYIYELREYYRVSRDFRLLKMVPDALVGRTPQQIYPFLQNLRTNLLYEIRKEATADELLARLQEVRTGAQSTVDLRALDLLESIIERQASEVLNQPGPHIENAVAALKRAFEREWADGEIRQMAEFLDGLGTIKQPGLNEERLRQLRELYRLTKPGTDDGLFVAWYLSHALYWSHDKKQEALSLMEIARKAYEQTHPEGWPSAANVPLEGNLELLEASKQFADAEAILSQHIESPLNPGQVRWLTDRRNYCYYQALRDNGRVSLGSGETLYRNLHRHLLNQLDAISNESHRYNTVGRLLEVFRLAKSEKYGVDADLTAFAFEKLPEILKTQNNNYSNLIRRTADCLTDVIGPNKGLEFLIVRYENYPKRYEYQWNNAWQRQASLMADYWEAAQRDIGDLEPRLLAVVTAELRRDLSTRYTRTRYFYSRHYHYWEAQADAFAEVADEVLKERENSSRTIGYVADYLYDDLRRQTRAIEVLLKAHDEKLLNLSQQITLCDYLHNQKENRYAESIPILQPIVASHPDEMSYRTRLLLAYHHARRPQQMRELLADTDRHFREEGRWTETSFALLAKTCLDIALFQEAVNYYGEVIPHHERTAPNRGVGQSTLSGYYQNRARAFAGLGQTKNAVDAAAAGVIAWGPKHEQRQSAIDTLRGVLASAKDLDAYVRFRNEEVQKTNEDSPLIRQMIGKVYADQNQYEKAVTQYRLALDLQLTNVEIHQQLIAAYDALGEKSKALDQTLALLNVDRHNLEQYKKLAQRAAADDSLAERAATAIVESAPNEAEHHQALAEFRQSQNRWGDAIRHWKQVASLREREPIGLLKLAEAQIHEERFDEARETIEQLYREEWPARFGNVRGQASTLEGKIPKE